VAVNPGFWANRLAALVGIVFAVAFLDSAGEAGLSGSVFLVTWVVLGPLMMVVGL
jgi:hypothetical protein